MILTHDFLFKLTGKGLDMELTFLQYVRLGQKEKVYAPGDKFKMFKEPEDNYFDLLMESGKSYEVEKEGHVYRLLKRID